MYVITELSFECEFFLSWNQIHPETVPVGPFESREEANEWFWAKHQELKATGGSWQVSKLTKPW